MFIVVLHRIDNKLYCCVPRDLIGVLKSYMKISLFQTYTKVQ